jgi:hypothetical protein
MASKTQVSPLQVYQSRDFNGLAESNHLSNAFLTEPEKVGSILAYAFGIQENNVLSLLTGGIGNTLYVNNREYEWDLHSQSDKAIEVSATSPDATNPMPGYGGQPFQVVLAEKWFEVTDVLVADDGATQARVMYEPEPFGSSYIYTLQNVSSNPKAFCDPEFLSIGARWSKEWSSVEEYSGKGGGHGFSTPYKLRNQLTTLRKTYKVSREAAKAVMVIELYDPADPSKKTKLWTKLSEWTAMAYWYRELDKSFIYSKYNKDDKGYVKLQGENKRPVYHGAGFREQISPANKRYYTKLTYEILDEFLLDLSYAASKWGGEHKFVALTGKMGMREFDRAIKAYAAGNNITVTDNGTFITGKGDELGFTGYFKTVSFMNGIELTVKEFEPYDDLIRNRELHPITKKPIESYRFTILNFGRKNGRSNIRKVAMQDSDMAMWHVCGSTDPYGGVAKSINMQRSSGIDGYEVHFLSQCGLMVEDPTSCGELILRVC